MYRCEESKIFLVMEYFTEGSLLNVIKTREFSNADKLNICAGITNGLWHLHASEVLHGDLALRNILIDTVKMRAVLSDFGQSCTINIFPNLLRIFQFGTKFQTNRISITITEVHTS